MLTPSSHPVRRVVAGAVVAGGSLLAAAFPVAAQQAFTERQCFEAVAIGSGIQEKYRGKISAKLIDSFIAFNRSNCDLTTNFVRAEGTADEDAFGEFRVRLIALRTVAIAQPTSLSK